jgi:hypothetical protein
MVVFVCGTICVFAYVEAAPDDPDVLLQKAPHLGDRYNWPDTASLFTETEQLYAARGDNRNVCRNASSKVQWSLGDSQALENGSRRYSPLNVPIIREVLPGVSP